MTTIPDDTLQEIRVRTDIVGVVGSYLPLKRSGANHLGLCPFHGEKTPSFNVNSVRQFFHCFGCGVGGDVYSFLMRIEGLSFPEAAKRLAERAGIVLELTPPTPQQQEQQRERERLAPICEEACSYYAQQLLVSPAGETARRYLQERGYGQETAKRFRLGYALPGWDGLVRHLAEKGYDADYARQLGLIRPGKQGRGDYDLFRGRLIFPIFDRSGDPVAFGARVLDGSLPKYINSPESPLYHKGKILYGLYQAREEMRRSGEVIVVEGYFDQLALTRAGFGQSVATCGTSLTEEHARLLKRYSKRVLLLFDADSAGRRATFRAMEVLLREGVPALVVTLDQGEDPDSYIKRAGSKGFAERLATARPALELFMEETLAVVGDSVEGRARGIEEILSRLKLLTSEIERDLYLQQLAQRSGLGLDQLRRQLGGSTPPPRQEPLAAPRQSPHLGRSQQTPPPVAPAARRAPPRNKPHQDWLLALMIAHAEAREAVTQEGIEMLFSDPLRQKLATQFLDAAPVEGKIDCEPLFAQLPDEQKSVLSAILMQDEKSFAEEPEALLRGCLAAVKREVLQRRSRELPARIAGATNDEERRSLLEELAEVNRQIKSEKNRTI